MAAIFVHMTKFSPWHKLLVYTGSSEVPDTTLLVHAW